VRVERSDEREATWENYSPVFRVYFFASPSAGNGPGYSTEMWDIFDADVLDAIRWAEARVPEGSLYAVALLGGSGRHDVEGDRVLTWLVGMDANFSPVDEWQEHLLAGMQLRKGRAVVVD
jgi:hypothetical protein